MLKKFRGKTIDTEKWIYGDFVRCQNNSFIAIYDDSIPDYTSENIHIYQVYPETVQQFIGIKDIDNKEIYEGDIVQWTYKTIYYGNNGETDFIERSVIGIIEYEQAKAGYSLRIIKNGFGLCDKYLISEIIDCNKILVIDNICDIINKEDITSSINNKIV